MLRFNKSDLKELKAFLYSNYCHDAKLENVQYDYKKDSIKVDLLNPIFDVKIGITFLNIEIAFAVRGTWFGSRETIISLTVEEDFSYLKNYLVKYSEHMEDFLYLLFQMFSGDELHVVSKEVIVEVIGREKE